MDEDQPFLRAHIIMDSIVAVAARIQDRANQLSSEQSILEILHVQVKDANYALEEKSEQNCRIREELLSKTMTRHSTELEVLRRKREIEELEEKISRLQNIEIGQLEQRVAVQRLEHDRVSSTVYATHEFEMELYRRKIESKLRLRRNKEMKRKGKLNDLILGSVSNREEITSIHKERMEIGDEISAMREMEVREDEEIASIAMQIRATLAKVWPML